MKKSRGNVEPKIKVQNIYQSNLPLSWTRTDLNSTFSNREYIKKYIKKSITQMRMSKSPKQTNHLGELQCSSKIKQEFFLNILGYFSA